MTWMDDLKPGDKVLIRTPTRSGATCKEATVEKNYKRHVIAGGLKFRKATSACIADDGRSAWIGRRYLAPWDPNLLASQEERYLRERLCRALRGVTEKPIDAGVTTARLREIVDELTFDPIPKELQ